MKRSISRLGGILCAALLFSAAACGGGSETPEEGGTTPPPAETPDRLMPAHAEADATIEVGGAVSGEEGAISGDLFGVFLEDINYASYALDDNMVINGSFQSKYQNKRYGWTAEGATLRVGTDDSPLGTLYRDYQDDNAVADHAIVEVPAAGGTLSNSGYPGVPMAVEEGVDYVFSAFIKTSGAQNVTVSVTDGQTAYATAEISIPAGRGWVKYRRVMTASASADANLKLQMSFSAAGTVQLDGVTLETTDSTVGINNYLYNAVKDLSPKFIRFPGGCIVEGENYNANDEQAYDWKNSVGAVSDGANAGDDTVPAFAYSLDDGSGLRDVTTYGEFVTRQTNTNLWQNDGDQGYYQMEYGIGFYEYFLLCESVGASALPVVNCGLSCQGQTYPIGTGAGPLPGRHGQYVNDYIRDAADLIEFAKGDETTKWGAIRANMGHPEPFEMDYIGIGNEQWNTGESATNYYTSYYEKFLEDEEFMETCGQYNVRLIVGNHQELRNCEGYDSSVANNPWGHGTVATGGDARNAALAYMQSNPGAIASIGEYGVQDHHYYNSPVDFFLHTHLYDNYTRTGANRYEVFVGEYSANNNFKYSGNFNNLYQNNNWFSALAEAAMMTGFERNGDIVRLAAYAPMFAPYRGTRDWPVDMMLFTNTQVVLTPNYYVQQIFMQNTGSRKMQASLAYADPSEAKLTLTGQTSDITAEIDRLYYVASLDEATGDILVKIVNAGDSSMKINVKFTDASLTGIAVFNQISEKRDAVSTLGSNEGVPNSYTIGGFTQNTAGITARANSLIVLRVHTSA